MEMEIAITNEENKPYRGSTPAMMENEMASGINAMATTRPASTSRTRMRGVRSAVSTDGSGAQRDSSFGARRTAVKGHLLGLSGVNRVGRSERMIHQ